jgi:hypothetical protein
VYASPLFITMEPVGGVVSFAALTSATSVSRNIAEDNNSNRVKADTARVLLVILSPPSNYNLQITNINCEAIFYFAQVVRVKKSSPNHSRGNHTSPCSHPTNARYQRKLHPPKWPGAHGFVLGLFPLTSCNNAQLALTGKRCTSTASSFRIMRSSLTLPALTSACARIIIWDIKVINLEAAKLKQQIF